ncbi:MOSC domain-containing protein [Blastopirellula marina]|uniref:MOSC domain-containing protein n=1 Tax=Blastopirellula marina TaxID=124 RepID=A0A2S8GDL8_9BACT|nr:MOSC domain-containing protein [Blastopirellula marina]PQO42184.1 hypothetical protein C5Y93_27960 [Blastopirellula marina]
MNKVPGHVIAVCLSSGGIPRFAVESGRLTERGFENDGHRYDEHCVPERAVTLFCQEMLDQFAPKTEPFPPGSVGENLTLAKIDLSELSPGARLRIGEVELRLEKKWKPCHAEDSVTGRTAPNDQQWQGFFASVLKPGTIQAGQEVGVLEADLSGK